MTDTTINTPSSTTTTGIRVTAEKSVWMLFLRKPHTVIDGVNSKGAWKRPAFFPATAGQHEVTVYYPYFIPPKAGKGTVSVTVTEGQVVEVGYRAPWWVFSKGKMKVG